MYTVAPNNIIFVVKWIHHVFIHISKKIDEIAHTHTHTNKHIHTITYNNRTQAKPCTKTTDTFTETENTTFH